MADSPTIPIPQPPGCGTIRFIGGPLDNQLLVIPDGVDEWRCSELVHADGAILPFDLNFVIAGSIITHYYQRAFDGSVYFKYQGTNP